MKKLIAMLLCTTIMVAMLAGCSTEEAVVEEVTVEEEATEEVVETEEVATDDKVWVVATDTVFKPFVYTNESGELVGIDIDLIAAIAEDQGFQYEIQAIGWDASVAAVQAGQADILTGATVTDERKENGWIFSDAYYNASQTFVVAEGSGITSFEQLEGQNVVVKNASASADFASSIMDEYGFTITLFDDSPTMYQDVILGNSAACVEDTPIMAASIKEGDLPLEIPDGMESDVAPYAFATMHEETQELLDLLNAGLANIIESGVYDEILEKYLG